MYKVQVFSELPDEPVLDNGSQPIFFREVEVHNTSDSAIENPPAVPRVTPAGNRNSGAEESDYKSTCATIAEDDVDGDGTNCNISDQPDAFEDTKNQTIGKPHVCPVPIPCHPKTNYSPNVKVVVVSICV